MAHSALVAASYGQSMIDLAKLTDFPPKWLFNLAILPAKSEK